MNAASEPMLPAQSQTPVPAGRPGPVSPASWSWVPVRSLSPRHRDRIAAHLLALSDADRYLRFGYPATDAQMSKYVDLLDFERDEVFGIFNRRVALIAVAHLAHPTEADTGRAPAMSEFGVSVLTPSRGRGFGKRLFEHAMLHARNRGVDVLFIHALSENTAMLKIAKDAGAKVQRDGSESEAWLELPDDTLGSHVDQLVEDQAAELDYQFKVRAHQVSRAISGLTGRVRDAAPAVED